MSEAAAASAALSVRELSIGFDKRRVLSGVTLEVPATGIVAIMGPGGVGKSSLLRTLARRNDGLPSFWFEGDVRLGERSLLTNLSAERANRLVPLLSQKAGLYTATVLENAVSGLHEGPLSRAEKVALAGDALGALGLWERFAPVLDAPVLSLSIERQRLLCLARLMAGGAQCLLADEPFRDLSEDGVEEIASLLEQWSRRRAVLMVSHSQPMVRRLAASVCLMTAGRVVEVSPVPQFFDDPATPLGAEYVRSGNCWPKADELADETAEESVEDEVAPSGPGTARRRFPGGFHWVVPELLGGMQRPGLLAEEEDDLAAVASLGAKVLVTLTEKPYQPARLAELGIRSVHFPIDDMGTPTLEASAALCERISCWIEEGVVSVLHCRAGLGRTGTMLACALVWRGATAVRSIERVRAVNSYYIQSREQLDFLAEFEGYVEALREKTRSAAAAGGDA